MIHHRNRRKSAAGSELQVSEGQAEAVERGLRLRLARRLAGFSQDELGQQLGIHKLTVLRYEAGRQSPGMVRANLMASALCVSLPFLGYSNASVASERLHERSLAPAAVAESDQGKTRDYWRTEAELLLSALSSSAERILAVRLLLTLMDSDEAFLARSAETEKRGRRKVSRATAAIRDFARALAG